jgi:acyl-CoA thioester hydrolase
MNKAIKCNTLNLKIYVEDTDFQGVVYHANYIKFFERARSEFLATNNISQDMLRKNNLAFVIKSINIKYLAAAELGDEIEVNSIVQKKSDARMIFNQKILNSKTRIEYVNGDVEVCFINLLTKKPQKFPDDLLLIFK